MIDPVTVTLRVFSDADSDFLAELRFVNHSNSTRFLNPINACVSGVISGEVFLCACDGKRLKYLGVVARKVELEVHDYIRIDPHSEEFSYVDLSSVFEFHTKGVHQYEFVYRAVHGSARLDGLYFLKSNHVSIVK